jgi:hypothetical protein
MENLPITKHSVFSSWNRDQVSFYRACPFDLMIFILHKTPTSPQAHPDGQLAFNETLLRVFVPHAVFSSWNRDQVIFYRACRFDLMIDSFDTKHLRAPRRFERGLCNERVPAMKAWLLPSCDEMVDGFVLVMKGWLQCNRGCSRFVVDESADGFILMDGTSHALLTRRGYLCFYCQDEARFFCDVGSAMLFF